jgi:hypothetical protein
MDVQNPSDSSHSPVRRPSVAVNLLGLLKAVVYYYLPHPWLRRAAVALVVIYFAPFIVARWLNAITRIIIVSRRLRNGDGI